MLEISNGHAGSVVFALPASSPKQSSRIGNNRTSMFKPGFKTSRHPAASVCACSCSPFVLVFAKSGSLATAAASSPL